MVFGSENGIPLQSVVEEGNDVFPVSVVGAMRPDGPELLRLAQAKCQGKSEAIKTARMGRGTQSAHSATGGIPEQSKHLPRVTPEAPVIWAASIIFYLSTVSILHNLKNLLDIPPPPAFGNTPPHRAIPPFPTQLPSASRCPFSAAGLGNAALGGLLVRCGTRRGSALPSP